MGKVHTGEAGPGRVAAAAQRGIASAPTTPWLRSVGVAAWLILGVACVLALALLLTALVAEVAIPLVVAAVLAALLVPLTDRLERWRVPRWLGATLVLIASLALVVAVVAVIIAGLVSQSDEIMAQVDSSLQQADTAATGAAEGTSELPALVQGVVSLLLHGVIGSLFSSASGFVVGCVLALFMLLFLLKDWSQITGWTAGHLGLPAPVGRSILDDTVLAFRGYAMGLTIIGAANAAVVLVGAWVLGVPLAGTIALVSFVTSYVPYLGAFVAGAFATLIAYGSGGLGDALAMLAIVLLANNTIQNLVEPFAFGTRLRLHPLAVLLAVTTATMLFGVMGAILAAPLTSAGVNAFGRLQKEGIFGAVPHTARTPATTDESGHPPRTDARPVPAHRPAPEAVETP
ncbi:AI-2E family transporter [Humibacillus xanthopallidus]|uniref:Putative PurR-regulated permease PerM n=1 Tax=Humibacillus xanthopallidus TaxID=412689 RepID=A0A543I254_9MICO|nr:AI-2E family transporter [Humibacillus xanthopallidus]TQM64665.1 putative PurR-regulated permease PerM [Humibacillus xanthopallidus]